MDQLIKALQLFRKYENRTYPTYCKHDMLYVCIDPARVSNEDKAKLDVMGFFPDDNNEVFMSFHFGSS